MLERARFQLLRECRTAQSDPGRAARTEEGSPYAQPYYLLVRGRRPRGSPFVAEFRRCSDVEGDVVPRQGSSTSHWLTVEKMHMAQGHSGGLWNPWFLASRSCFWMDSKNWRCETKEEMPLFFQRFNAATDAAITVQRVPFAAAAPPQRTVEHSPLPPREP
jgi:hypothetical protein